MKISFNIIGEKQRAARHLSTWNLLTTRNYMKEQLSSLKAVNRASTVSGKPTKRSRVN